VRECRFILSEVVSRGNPVGCPLYNHEGDVATGRGAVGLCGWESITITLHSTVAVGYDRRGGVNRARHPFGIAASSEE
jgi:hypothetical protein